MKLSYSIPIALAIGALAGCASGPPRQTTADLTRAHALIASAEASGAQEYAAADLQSARDKATEADQQASHDSQRADRLANEAAVDAELASARTQDSKSQHSLADLHRSLQTLRNEAERNAKTPPGETAPEQPQASPSATSPPRNAPAPLVPSEPNAEPPSSPPPGPTLR